MECARARPDQSVTQTQVSIRYTLTSISSKIFGPAGQIGDNKGGKAEGGIKSRISADGPTWDRTPFSIHFTPVSRFFRKDFPKRTSFFDVYGSLVSVGCATDLGVSFTKKSWNLAANRALETFDIRFVTNPDL